MEQFFNNLKGNFYLNMNPRYVIPAIAAGIAIVAIIVMMNAESQFSENQVVTQSPDENQITIPTPQPVQENEIEPIPQSIPIEENEPAPEVEQTVQSIEYEIFVTNGEKHIVPLDKIKSGGPPPDGIPSIDDPKFTEADNENHVADSDIVLGLEINGEAKAYPLSILVWHEIVNDNVGGVPVAVTYCPLCFTNQVFERVLDGQSVEFGTSGKLYNSNLVMYDRMTGTYWSQGLGLAIKGELTGQSLNIIPFDVITWGDWKKLYPDTVVLTTNTGHIRAYGVDPYGDYYTDPRIIFPVEYRDDRMHPKEIILGFHEGLVFKAYKQQDVESSIVINDQVNNEPILLVSLYSGNARSFDRMVDGEILEFTYKDNKIVDINTNSEWNYDGVSISGELEGTELERLAFNPGFWFEWIAFHPETQVYGGTT